MKTEQTIKELTELKKGTTDPIVKKEIEAKLEFLKSNKDVKK